MGGPVRVLTILYNILLIVPQTNKILFLFQNRVFIHQCTAE